MFPSTDDSGGEWGQGGARDNWLVHEDVRGGDSVFSAVFATEDDDTSGVVHHQSSDDTSYIFAVTAIFNPPTVERAQIEVTFRPAALDVVHPYSAPARRAVFGTGCTAELCCDDV